LYKLWQSYAAELLGLTSASTPPTTHGQFQSLAAKLSSADFHGAYVVVTRSKCVSRVRLEGIILRDTRSAFVVVTKSNALRILPKEHTVFRIADEVGDPKFEVFSVLLYGSQLMYRPADRSGRKFKSKPTGDL
ncbi:Rof/RNase P-like protein, partial [Lipomyces tetrasporus]